MAVKVIRMSKPDSENGVELNSILKSLLFSEDEISTILASVPNLTATKYNHEEFVELFDRESMHQWLYYLYHPVSIELDGGDALPKVDIYYDAVVFVGAGPMQQRVRIHHACLRGWDDVSDRESWFDFRISQWHKGDTGHAFVPNICGSSETSAQMRQQIAAVLESADERGCAISMCAHDTWTVHSVASDKVSYVTL